MPIKVGDRLPNATFRVMTPEGPKPKTTDEVFKGKKVVLFAVPGAFTPIPTTRSSSCRTATPISPRRSGWTSMLRRWASAPAPSAIAWSSTTAW
jgi:hypothetical protein